MDQDISMDDFQLSCELTGHTMDVRSVAEGPNMLISGSRDKTTRVWTDNYNGTYTFLTCLEEHEKFVSRVVYIASEDWICTGSNDSTIKIYQNGCEKPFITLKGHTSTVTSLCAGLRARSVVSGSWDCTVKIWTISPLNEVSDVTLRGHEAAVWSVCTTKEEKFVSAAADKNIFIWNKDGEKVRVLRGHTDCVRAVLSLPNGSLISTGNDALIKVWDESGDCIKTLSGHNNYIYSMSLMSDNIVVTGSEDSTIRLWDIGKGQLGEAKTVPAQSVWSVCALKNGDIAAGSSDGVVRIFSKNPSNIANSQLISTYNAQVDAFTAGKEKELGGYKVNDIPGPESLQFEGTEEGQKRLVREKNGKVMCYEWSNGSWNLIGDVTGASGGSQETSGKTLYEGREYDYVFSIDVEDGKPALKLPFNKGQDPYVVAQKFIHQNNLPQAYLDQVATFIITNSNNAPVICNAESQGYYDPFTGGSRYIPGNTSAATQPAGTNFDPFTGGSSYSTKRPRQNLHYPVTDYILLESGDLSKIEGKLREFNGSKAGDKRVNEKSISSFIEMGRGTASGEGVKLLAELLRWPAEAMFPVLDVIRLALLHDNCCAEILNPNLMEALLTHLNSGPPANQIMACRGFVNMFKFEIGRDFLKDYNEIIVLKLPQFSAKDTQIQIAVASLLLNWTVAKDYKLEMEPIVESIILSALSIPESDALFRVLQAVGTVTSNQNASLITKFKSNSSFMAKLNELSRKQMDGDLVKLKDIAASLLESFN